MINSKGSVVAGDERTQRPRPEELVVPDGGGEREEPLQYPGGHSRRRPSAVSLQVELGLQGLVDRLDDLSERLQEGGAGTRTLPLECRPNQDGAVVDQEGVELAALIALVG